jgi:hypothetical protein
MDMERICWMPQHVELQLMPTPHFNIFASVVVKKQSFTIR